MPKKTTAETRTFKPHPALLLSVIRNQAGTIGKAILELVMNSLDAGCTRVDIELTRHTFKVVDDGKGFVSRQEIEEFFEYFGTPHQAGDAVYGRFRIGRGQIMAFSRSTWRSGEFRMGVDVEGNGLDYTLEAGLASVKGCSVEGDIYEDMVLSPSELIQASNQLREQCRFTPAPVYLNGERINEDVAAVKWTEVTEDAFIKVDSKSNRLSIYNLGVLVNHEYASANGVGGIVVSKKALEVNFARNDVIKGKCPVWKRIKPVLAKHASDTGTGAKKHKVTDEWRDYMAQHLLAWDGNPDTARELVDASIFPDVAGKHFSLNQLDRHKVTEVTVAPGISLKADRIQQSGVAIVLDGEKMGERFSRKSLEFVLEHIIEEAPKGKHALSGDAGWLGHQARRLLDRLVAFKELADDLDGEHHILADAELSKAGAVSLSAIRQAQCRLPIIITAILKERNVRARTVYAMKSETAEAFTDGRRNIYIHEKFLSGEKYGPKHAITWAVEVAHLLVHEYLHDDNNGTGCVHDAEFHELYHSVTSSHGFAEAVRYLFEIYADKVKRTPTGIFSRTLDRLAAIEDKVGVVQPALAKSKKERKPKPPVEASLGSFYGKNGTPVPDVKIVDGFDLTPA